MDKKALIKKHASVAKCLFFMYNHFSLKNKLRLRGNVLQCNLAMLKNVKFDVKGKGNRILIHDFTKITNSAIRIRGNDNLIEIGEHCYLNGTILHIANDQNEISIGSHTSIHGKTQLAAIESTKIKIGSNCMFASHIHFRTSDSHSIFDAEGVRINPAQDIIVGAHTWIGMNVTCLKGVEIAEDCIVATCSLLTKKYMQPKTIIGGGPAKILKKNVTWSR